MKIFRIVAWLTRRTEACSRPIRNSGPFPGGALDRSGQSVLVYGMNTAPVHPALRAGFGLLICVAGLSGCATTEPPNGAKIIVDVDKYATRDAPVGSHLKPHVRVSDNSTIAPT